MVLSRSVIRIHVALVALGLVGCSGLAQDTGKGAGQGATSGVIVELKKPENQQSLAAVATSPGAQEASQAVGIGLGRGVVDEVLAIATGQTPATIAGQRAAALNPNASTQPDTMPSDHLSAYMQDNIDPAIAELIRQSVEKGICEALGPQSRADAGKMAYTVGDNAVRGALAGLRDGGPMLDRFTNDHVAPGVGIIMSQQVRPVLRDFFNQDMAPTVIRIFQEAAANALKIPTRPDLAQDVVTNADHLSKGAGFGSRDAAIDMGLLSKDGSITPGTRAFIWGVVTVMVLVGLVAVGFLIVLTMIALKLRGGSINVQNSREPGRG